jgi:hypothetical protein
MRRSAVGSVAQLLAAVAVVALAGVFVFAGLASMTRPAGPRPLPLLTHHQTTPLPGGTEGSITGVTIERDGECTFATVAQSRWLIIWPSGTTLDAGSDPAVIRDSRGQRITDIGEIFSMHGEAYAADKLDELRPDLDSDVPPNCRTSQIYLVNPDVAALKPGPATWQVDPANPPTTSDQSLHVLLEELACHSRLTPYDRIQLPQIEYEPDSIVITISVLEVGGRCPGTPASPYTIDLSEPIGDRDLVDGYDGSVQWPTSATISPPSVEPKPSPTETGGTDLFTTDWRLDAAAPVNADSMSFHALVTQTACGLEASSVGPVVMPDIVYANTAIVVTFTAQFGFNPEACNKLTQGEVVVPTLVQLTEPIGDRVLRDGGQLGQPARWQGPPPDALPLPSYQQSPYQLGVAIGQPGICAGVGLDAVVIDGSPDDPRLVWLSSDTSQSGGRGLLWPPGFTVRFTDGVEVLDETAAVVHRGGESEDGACVVGDGALSLYGDGYVVLK